MSTVAEEPKITWAGLRNGLQRLAEEKREWAGIPVPVDGSPLVLEPRYPWAALATVGQEKCEADDSGDWVGVNHWYSRKRAMEVIVYHEKGRAKCLQLPTDGAPRFNYVLETLGCAFAWDFEAELAAMERLQELITPWAYRCYVMTGTFLESSQRSGVAYMFRRLRPTIAMVADPRDDKMKLLAILCLHPIGYYQDTFAGAMVPTDDVIAHLLLMRGDEHKFWGKANHHQTWMTSSGL